MNRKKSPPELQAPK